MLVRDVVVRLLENIDPTLKTMVTITTSNVSSWNSAGGGDKFTTGLVMNIYNNARLSLFNALSNKYGNDIEALSEEIISSVAQSSAITWTVSGGAGSAPKPTGYLRFISMQTAASVPMILLPQTLLTVVRSGSNPYYTQSATNILIFDLGTNFIYYGSSITTASDYVLNYYGLTQYTVTDVTNGSTVEQFDDKWIPALLELGQAIASEMGTNEINALAARLVGAPKG